MWPAGAVFDNTATLKQYDTPSTWRGIFDVLAKRSSLRFSPHVDKMSS